MAASRMSDTTYRPRRSVGRPVISLTLGLLFVVIGLYQVLTNAASLTVGILTLIVGLLSCGLALYRIFYLRGIRDN